MAKDDKASKNGEKEKEVVFFNAQEGVRGRDGGPYGDVVDAEMAETKRAKAEKREPDYENLMPSAANQIVIGQNLEDNIWSNPSMAAVEDPLAARLQSAKEEALEDENRPTPQLQHQVLAVDTRTELPDSEREESEEASVELQENPSNVAATSTTSVGSKPSGSGKAAANRTSNK
jgi:hypothetical protein